MTSRRGPLPALLILAVLALAGTAAPAGAATKNGITPKTPKRGAAVPAGKSPVFRMAVRGRGPVWVHVCEARKRNRKGVICRDEMIGRAKKRRGLHRHRPRFYDFPGFWLNRPGVYFWQAHRIHCRRGNTRDCLQEGPVVRFRVRAGGA